VRRLLRRLVRTALLVALTAGAGLAAYGTFLVQNLGLDRAEVERRAATAATVAVPAEASRAPYDAQIVAPLAIGPGDIPDYVKAAFIVAEDRHFRWHFGVDPLAVGRAASSWLRAQAGDEDIVVTGGSTISMQLAKLLFLESDRTLKRKLDQIVLAVWLEWLFTKEEILALYLNNAYFGDGCYGIEAAARHYFGRSVMKPPRIDLMETAMLARTVPAPSLVNPNRNRERLERAAQALLAEMARQGTIDPEEAATMAAAKPRPLGPKAFRITPFFFRDEALRALLPADLRQVDERLTLGLTLEPEAQLYAEIAAADALAQAKPAGYDQVAVVVMRPDGAIAALVGGADYAALNGFDIAFHGSRSPGSTLKPFIYLCALEGGKSGATPVLDEPRPFAAGWTPRNQDGRWLGRISLKEALIHSRNGPAVAELQSCGFERFGDILQRVGITADMPRKLTIALGSAPVPLIQLTAAYAGLANGGRSVAPYAVWYARRPGGRLLYRHRPGSVAAAPAIERSHYCALTQMLRAAVTSGTGRNAAFAHPVAGKTGTSGGYRDALFVGFSAHYAVGVWLGATGRGEVSQPVTGSGLPALAFRRIMATLHVGKPVREIGCATHEAAAETVEDRG
jgi:penicillin-binding protein 1A